MRSSEEIIDYLNQLREEQDVSISELARRVGMAKSGVSRYFNHTREFPINRAPAFAKALHIKTEDLLGLEPINQNKSRMVPLLGTIAMGAPITAEQNIEKYIPEYMMDRYADDTLFALRCQGDSMYPLIPNGAIATIRQQTDVEDGEIAAVLINGEATLKKVLHVGKTVVLRPANPDYKDIILDKDHPGTILGKMIKYEMNFD
ncbi:LexA family transcriptional regulator [Lactobacillus gasseri]|uniref:LexA family protein n=1 Tax=Lactobacillus gasseri TaxID=1596 RepID=UPI000E42D7FA|nr:LexA family transcriptional regulator [Lactobacillus gasseri]MCZ3944382.1 LexA family transcriptional regulator [Lactobacillus gasseri]MCZ3947116.1 LexA family transcriptional regulator [Lactobacillus gasseri]MCZ3980976.1 LexA family transcriptional regulator [Lactobacillus gasseri]MCZ3995136.1 LexA family transcriptional regulator [Lactobacillus gasseri]MCZ4003354.1 LexA family transcriptional regulator [Lactobacillus gasseri]